MITVNIVRDGMVGAIKEAFPDRKVYDEEIKQGLRPPAFFIKLLSTSQDREIGRRYMRTHLFDVHYFTDTNEDGHAIAETLYDILENIVVPDGKIRGTGMNHEVVGDILHFFVDYNVHVLRTKPVFPLMQKLEQEVSVKDG